MRPSLWLQAGLSRLVSLYPFSTGKWFLRRAASGWLVAAIGGGILIRTSGTVDAEWCCLDGVAKEDRTVQWLRGFLKPDMTVVDVGANIGYISLHAAQIVGPRGRVLSIEPTPKVANRLRENVRINGFAQVAVIEAAATKAAGPLRFFESKDDPEANSLFSEDAGTFLTVAGVTLDEAVPASGIAHVDLIKIDAEGAEVDVLLGAKRLLSSSRPPTLLFEANPIALATAGSSVEELLSLVSTFGYACTEVERFEWRGETVINYVAVGS